MGVGEKGMTKIITIMVIGFVFVMFFAVGGLNWVQSAVSGQQPATTQPSQAMGGQLVTTQCGDDGKGIINLRAINPLNTTGKEYIAITGNVYLVDGSKSFIGTFSTNANATPTTLSYDCGRNYVLTSFASDGSHTSVEYSFTANQETSAKDLAVNQQAGLLMRMYDNNEKKYIYADGSDDASSWQATGTTFKSTTSNSTATTLDVGQCLDLTIEYKSNTTAGTDTIFTDMQSFFGINANSEGNNDYSNPSSVSLNGMSLSIMSGVDNYLVNNGYENVYVSDVKLGQSTASLRVQICPISGINPDNDIKIGVFTSGLYESTSSSDAKTGISKDDVGTHTPVFSGVIATLDVA
ncbi:MAG: hypothetical protein CVU81_01210 [Euryarchaeota archaeon HGW-Euryarchaeota-1]|nr:MAG: hypothetical protein CVU81_01210 [Euryarchaeota archaeon HGW-Euryarchaeota-1]